MAWIRTVPESEATGTVKDEYEAGIERAGRVYNTISGKLYCISGVNKI